MQTGNDSTKEVEIVVLIKYLSHFSWALEMLLTNCETSLPLKWSNNCILVAYTTANQNLRFQINNTNLSVPVVTLSTQENIKRL